MKQTEALQDPLKSLAEVTCPDSRRAYFVYGLEDNHRHLASMTLHEGVPLNVRQLFETAKNVSLYSWYVYRFHQVAEMVGFQALEFALRLKAESYGLKKAPRNRRWTLGSLLAHAKENQWLATSAYPYYRKIAFRRAQQNVVFELSKKYDSFVIPEPTLEQIALAESKMDVPGQLEQTLPFIRNDLAHGSSTLSPSSVGTLQLIFETINQLFLEPSADG